jgi:hypothetical protein
VGIRMKKKTILTALVVAFLSAVHVFGQAVPPPIPPAGLPIDGGILFLLISGILFGVKKLKKN